MSEQKIKELNALIFGIDSQEDQSNPFQLSLSSTVNHQENPEENNITGSIEVRKRSHRDDKKFQKFKDFMLGADANVQIYDP